ncbi:hypothetical protein J3F84DRAFT_94112 [Trichoderma pleuroticola]
MTTPCSLGLPNLNSPSSPPSFLVLFLLPLWLICVSFNLVPCADSFFFFFFFFAILPRRPFGLTGNLINLAARPFLYSFSFPSPCWPLSDFFLGYEYVCLSF